MILGLTGSIASGKSTVAKFFQELGAYLIDWDVLAKEVQRPHQKAWEGIVECFGKEVLNKDLTLNRRKLAEIVFKDKEKLHKLNQIVHPEVFKEDQRVTNQIRSADPDALIIKDIPLLGESDSPLTEMDRAKIADKILVVYASEENQLKRLKQKGMTEEEAKRRIKAQMPIDEKVKIADFVIYNDGSLEETRRQVEKIYQELKREGK